MLFTKFVSLSNEGYGDILFFNAAVKEREREIINYIDMPHEMGFTHSKPIEGCEYLFFVEILKERERERERERDGA